MIIQAKYYTPDEIAELLSMNPESIRRWIRNRELKAFRVGRELRVGEDDLREYLESHRIGPEEEDGDTA